MSDKQQKIFLREDQALQLKAYGAVLYRIQKAMQKLQTERREILQEAQKCGFDMEAIRLVAEIKRHELEIEERLKNERVAVYGAVMDAEFSDN